LARFGAERAEAAEQADHFGLEFHGAAGGAGLRGAHFPVVVGLPDVGDAMVKVHAVPIQAGGFAGPDAVPELEVAVPERRS
jgi:hypothetical protein